MVGLTPESLREETSWTKFEPIFQNWMNLANQYLADAWQYTLMIPHEHYRLRLACAWPILMGKRTLHLLHASSNPLEPRTKRKISRREIRGIVWSTTWRVPFRGPWNRLFGNK